MITLADIPGMLEALRSGELRDEDVDGLLIDLLADNEVDEIGERLPGEIRARFHVELRRLFAEHIPLEDIFLFDSARGLHPDTDKIAASARRWLRQNDNGSAPE